MDRKNQQNSGDYHNKSKIGMTGKISLLVIAFSATSIALMGIVAYLVAQNMFSTLPGENSVQALHSMGLIVGLVVLAFIMTCIPLAVIFSRIMTKPIIKLNKVFSSMARGEVDFDLQLLKEFKKASNDELGQMMESFIAMVENRKYLAAVADLIAKGDLTVSIEPQFEKDVLSHSLIEIVSQLNLLNAEMEKTGREVAYHGHFDFNGNSDMLSGSYKQFVLGFNMVLGGLIQPLQMASQYINDIGAGKIPEKITDTYTGDFNVLKDSINACIDGLGALVEGNDVLAHISKNDLTRKVEGNYCGIYGSIAESINRVAVGFNAIVTVSNNIAQGELSDLDGLKKFGKQSEQDTLIPSQIAMIETILLLIEETELMTVNAITGNLGKRGNTSLFKGEYSKVIEGFNKTLDAVIAPITEALKTLMELSQGNLQTAMVGEYSGDHAEIKEALNKTVKFLKRYVDQITLSLKEIQQRNLNHEITSFYQGDFFEIKTALNDITTELTVSMSDINNAAEQVESGAQQISSGGQALAQGATEQASAIEELTASIEEVAEETKKNVVKANHANEITARVKENVEIGNSQMKTMINAMGDINISSQNISKIIKVIDDIAFQTNMLALNAAVEAARAGQHGKGFAVVAEEVRTLAARSADAAKETTGLIQGSIEKVMIGTKIADQTATSLNEILNQIEAATDIVGQIAKASSEQASAIAQITQGIEQVSLVVQTNSATAQESAAASEELTSQAEVLKHKVNSFILKDQDIIGVGMQKSEMMIKKNFKPLVEPRINLDSTEIDKY